MLLDRADIMTMQKVSMDVMQLLEQNLYLPGDDSPILDAHGTRLTECESRLRKPLSRSFAES